MTGVKISELPAIAAPALTDELPTVQSGVTYKVTNLQLSTLFGFSGGVLPLANGGTNAALTASQNSLVYGTATAMAFLPTASNGVLVTDSGGVPSIGSTLPVTVQTNITELGAQSQALDMNTHLFNNVVDPVSQQDAATKNYVDQIALGGTSVYAATTVDLTVTQAGSGVGATLTNAGAQATFALDGVNPPLASNVLVKNLAAPENEGIYTVTDVGSGATDWILTRATTYDTPTEINATGLIVVQNGSTLAGTVWYNSEIIVTVDTTPLNYNEFGNITFPVTLAHGGTNANLTANNGGIFYSTASAGAILAGTPTAGLLLKSGASGAPSWLATVNSAGLLTNGSGLPGWVAYTGTGAPVLANTPTLITPNLGLAKYSGLVPTANGNALASADGIQALAILNSGGASVNYFQLAPSITTQAPILAVAGSDANINMTLNSKGTGGVTIRGTSAGGNAASGYVGETVSSSVLFASAVSVSNNTARDVTSISLTAGDWDIHGNIFISTSGAATVYEAWSSNTSATAPDPSLLNAFVVAASVGSGDIGLSIPYRRVNITTTTTVYLSCLVAFSSGACTACGNIYARRAR